MTLMMIPKPGKSQWRIGTPAKWQGDMSRTQIRVIPDHPDDGPVSAESEKLELSDG